MINTLKEDILDIEVVQTVETNIITTPIIVEVGLETTNTTITDISIRRTMILNLICGIVHGVTGEINLYTQFVLNLIVTTTRTTRNIPQRIQTNKIGNALNVILITSLTELHVIAVRQQRTNENLQMVFPSPTIPVSLLFILSWVDPTLLNLS